MSPISPSCRASFAIALCTVIANAQLVEHPTPIQLTPALPNVQGLSPAYRNLTDYKLTIGDVNNDGVPDLVFSNAVAYLAVYFLQYGNPSTQDNLTVAPSGYVEIMPFNPPPTCPTTGPDCRYLSQEPWGMDTPLIYDIDLDGKNELIYLEHVLDPKMKTAGTVGLQLWEWTGSAFQKLLSAPVEGPAEVFHGASAVYLPACNMLPTSSRWRTRRCSRRASRHRRSRPAARRSPPGSCSCTGRRPRS